MAAYRPHEVNIAAGDDASEYFAELKKLEVKHIISHSRKRYILYMERLKKYLEERS